MSVPARAMRPVRRCNANAQIAASLLTNKLFGLAKKPAPVIESARRLAAGTLPLFPKKTTRRDGADHVGDWTPSDSAFASARRAAGKSRSNAYSSEISAKGADSSGAVWSQRSAHCLAAERAFPRLALIESFGIAANDSAG